jgi:hypothetical protein
LRVGPATFKVREFFFIHSRFCLFFSGAFAIKSLEKHSYQTCHARNRKQFIVSLRNIILATYSNLCLSLTKIKVTLREDLRGNSSMGNPQSVDSPIIRKGQTLNYYAIRSFCNSFIYLLFLLVAPTVFLLFHPKPQSCRVSPAISLSTMRQMSCSLSMDKEWQHSTRACLPHYNFFVPQTLRGLLFFFPTDSIFSFLSSVYKYN